MKSLLSIVTPNFFDRRVLTLLSISQLIIFLTLWFLSPLPLFPTPPEVLSSLGELWRQGLGAELVNSFTLSLEAVTIGTLFSLLLTYSGVLMFFQPIVATYGKLRFLSMAGLTFFFTLMVSNTHELKLSMLAFSMSVFSIVGMVDVVNSIPKEQFDLARTLQMGEWEVVWEVIVLGQIDKMFDVIRQNAAMAWMMLTLVESTVKSEGGIGSMLMDQNHHFRLPAVAAIQLCILALGLVQDIGIGTLKKLICPYADLVLEKK